MAKRKTTKRVDDEPETAESAAPTAASLKAAVKRKPGDGSRMLSSEEVAEIAAGERAERGIDEDAE